MVTIAFFALCFFCFIAYLIGYSAGAQDKAKEMENKFSLLD